MASGTKRGRNSALRTRQIQVEPGSGADGEDQRENRFRRLFETAHDGILVLDEHTRRIVDANARMTHLFGFSREEFLGKELWEIGFVRGTDQRKGESHVVSGLGVIRLEELFLQNASHPDGVDLEIMSSTYHEDGTPMIQLHVRDITERKRTALSTAQQVEAHTVADRRRNEFIAILSHELRNALAPVSNALMILRLAQEADGPVPGRARMLIERQVGHLSHLVNDLQEISSLGSGRMRLQPGVVDLRTVVQRSVEAVMSAHANRQLEVSVALPEGPVLLDADAIRLEQVVVNLLSNAATYTPDGGSITVNVNLARGRAELRVADSGIGIESDMLPHVFDLFTRSESARTHATNGMGIGLNIVKHIVDLHGGSVMARSDGPDSGSEFLVSLPLTRESPAV